MVRRTPSKILDVGTAGALWACGVFDNMEDWCRNTNINRVVCLLPRPNFNLRKRMEFYTHMDFNNPSELSERLLEVLQDITTTIYGGGNVVVHCQHGLQRTGAVVTLWLALSLATGDMAEAGLESLLSASPWSDRLDEAFGIWADGRQLDFASSEGRASM